MPSDPHDLDGHVPAAADAAPVRRRRAPRADDRILTPATLAWLRSLPPRRRPLQLAAQFPRIANRIAWCWDDDDLTAQVFDDLLVDRRGGRIGFPDPVRRELVGLRRWRPRQESNLHLRLRRSPFCPLNYGGVTTDLLMAASRGVSFRRQVQITSTAFSSPLCSRSVKRCAMR